MKAADLASEISYDFNKPKDKHNAQYNNFIIKSKPLQQRFMGSSQFLCRSGEKGNIFPK
jgi:hypothetical protein